jgi:hypothetical protein
MKHQQKNGERPKLMGPERGERGRCRKTVGKKIRTGGAKIGGQREEMGRLAKELAANN